MAHSGRSRAHSPMAPLRTSSLRVLPVQAQQPGHPDTLLSEVHRKLVLPSSDRLPDKPSRVAHVVLEPRPEGVVTGQHVLASVWAVGVLAGARFRSEPAGLPGEKRTSACPASVSRVLGLLAERCTLKDPSRP